MTTSINKLRQFAQDIKDKANAATIERGVAGASFERYRATVADDLIAFLDTLPVQPALTRPDIEAVVREAIDHSRHLPYGQAEPAIAARVAEKLAGAVVSAAPVLSADDIRSAAHEACAWAHDQSLAQPFEAHIAERLVEHLAGRGVSAAQREADLREAFLAGAAWSAGPTIVEAARHHREEAAAEYARSKAGR